MNLLFQGEIVDINKRAAEILAQQEAERQKAQNARGEQTRQDRNSLTHQRAHEKEVRTLFSHFVRWAKSNHIPYNYHGGSHSLYKNRPLLAPHGWILAAYTVTTSNESNPSYSCRIVVNRREKIFLARQGSLNVEDFSPITTSSIQEHIAHFVATYNIPWDE